MSATPDGDDDELVDIEIELDGPLPRPDAVERAEDDGEEPEREPTAVEASDIIELRAPLVEAAESDPRADRSLMEAEAAAAADPRRRAILLLEVARLAEVAPSAPGAGSVEALEAARRAFASAPTLDVALWTLRRHLVRAQRFDELAEAYALAAAAGGNEGRLPAERADLLVERAWLLAGPLDLAPEAARAFYEALEVEPDHPSALLSLLLLGASWRDPEMVGAALEGLAHRAEDGTRRTALAIEAARAYLTRTDGPIRALGILEAELETSEDTTPVGMLLAELEPLTRAGAGPEVSGRALEQIARRVGPVDPPLAVALWRERARALGLQVGGGEAAMTALDEAARLDPSHPLVAAERLELAELLGHSETADAVAREHVEAAATDDEAVDCALLHAVAARRGGRDAAAAAILEMPRVDTHRAGRPDLRAFDFAAAASRHDAAALAEWWLVEASLADGGRSEDSLARAHAFAAAAVLHQGPLGNPAAAEDDYRRALEASPAHPAALEALVALLATAGRPREAADLLENALASGMAGPREVWARETLVALYASDSGDPAGALPHQRRLVALAPEDVGARVRLRDLELGTGLALGEAAADDWLELAELAANLEVAIALRVEAGRALAASPDPTARRRGTELLDELVGADASGLAASALEREVPRGSRAAVVAREVESAANAPAEIVRALRFRLAHHHAAEARYAEALAALTPLRSEGDPLARAWSFELARRSGDPILEIAILSEDVRTSDAPLGSGETLLFAHGQALARAGDPSGASAMLRRALAATPPGPAAAEVALELFRIAASDTRGPRAALAEGLRALAAACRDDPALATLAAREEQLERVAAGVVQESDVGRPFDGVGADPRARAEQAVVRFVAGVRLGRPQAVAEALAELAFAASVGGRVPDALVPLLARAVARARLAGGAAAETVARQAWRAAHASVLGTAMADLPGSEGGLPDGRRDTRRARARRVGPALGMALELEVAYDAERRGALGVALAAYGAVIDLDPERLEAWTGIRRVARAAGDVLGEARALARLGALVRDPERAAVLLVDAADAYEQAGRVDDAITALAKAVELRPSDAATAQRIYDLLRSDLDAPGRAMLFDNLLSHRLVASSLAPSTRAALLYERALHRLQRLGDRPAAYTDLEQILNILPEHREALFTLARGAVEEGDARSAVVWLERFLAAARDDARAPAARLDLAAAYEATRDRMRAVETLRRAASARPQDPVPLERLADVQLRAGDWRGAVVALRSAESRTTEPRGRGAVSLRVGGVLRDLGRDPASAATAFTRAAELDPLGEGTAALLALHDAAGDRAGALQIATGEIARVRQALAGDPLDARLLERLRRFLALALERGIGEPVAEAEAVVTSLLGLLGDGPVTIPAVPPVFAPAVGRSLFAETLHPAANGFIAEVWPNLLEAAAALFPAPPGPERRPVVAPPWIAAVARTLGLTEVTVSTTRDSAAPAVAALEDPAPGLVLGPGAESAPALPFLVGRGLGLLLQNATLLERVSPDQLAPLFACAAILAGAPAPRGLPAPSEEMLRTVTRALGRRPRKALTLQASRFAFEGFDVRAWHEGVLRSADRLGLLVGGDVASAAVTLAGLGRTTGAAENPGAPSAAAVSVATSGVALDLVRFALGDRYPALRRTAKGTA